MKDQLVIVPSNGSSYDEMGTAAVELARKSTGKLFRKHILNKGTLIHPATGEKLDIDDDFVATLKKNFDDKVCDIVQVPLANDKNEHSEDPDRNIGEVIGIEETDDKVYAVLDIRDEKAAPKMGKTLLGASAMMHLNYKDTRTGEYKGPTLLHSCVTNRPYVLGLDDYEEIVAASADSTEEAVLLTEEPAEEIEKALPAEDEQTLSGLDEETENMPTLEEMLKALKEEHSIDVEALKEQAAKADGATELSNALVAALKKSDVVSLSASAGVEDVTKAVTDLAAEKVALSNRLETLEKDAAANAVDALITEGRVVPSQKDALVELKLSNPSMFDKLVPAEPIIKMSNESGSNPKDTQPEVDLNKELDRLVTEYGLGK